MTRILIVEDESIVAKDIKTRLRKLGYTIPAVVPSGEKAVEEAGRTTPDLILMDIVLKGEIDGIEAAERIRTEFGIPVVYLTAHADEDTLQRAKVTEPYGYILKPFKDRELRTTIEMALHKHQMEKKVRESEQWLFTTLKSIGDAVITTDTKGLITFMNSAAEMLTGWEQEDAVRKPLQDVFAVINGKTKKKAENLATKVLRAESSVELSDNRILLAKDGKRIPIDSSAAPIKDRKGNITGAVLVFRNIAERKCAEEALQKSRLQLKSLFEASKLINSTMDMDEVFTFISDSVHLLVGFDHFIIFLVSEDRTHIYAAYTSDGIREKIENLIIEYGKGLVGRCIRNAETLFSNDAYGKEGDIAIDMRSRIIVPLILEDQCVGALHVSKSTQNEYSQDDVTVLNLLSEVVSAAIRNSRMHNEIKEFNLNLEERVRKKSKRTEIILNTKQKLQTERNWEKGLITIVESMKELEFERVGVFLVNPLKKTLDFHFGKGIGLPEMGTSISLKKTEYSGVQCVLKKKTIHAKTASSLEGKQMIESDSVVWVPIIVQDEAYAALAAGSVTGKKIMTDEDVNDLEILAGMCAAFIDRTRISIKPVAEERLKTEVKHWLAAMEGYIIMEKRPRKSLEIFADLVTHGIPGFAISRTYPEKLKRKYRLSKTPMLWLSRTGAKNTIGPDDLPKLSYIIEDFTRMSEESVVLLDGIEYLVTQTNFDVVLGYLQELKDTIVLNNSRLIIPLHGETLSTREFSILEREFTILS
jgi:PAS domain S-box-containing protein